MLIAPPLGRLQPDAVEESPARITIRNHAELDLHGTNVVAEIKVDVAVELSDLVTD